MSTPASKRCARCGSVKPCEDYHRNAGAADGLQSYCKSCNTKQAQAAEWNKAGIDFDEDRYQELCDEQAGRCAICDSDDPGAKRLAVDHAHESGRVRALLCQGCNTGLGKFRDDPALLRRAADYIESHRGQEQA